LHHDIIYENRKVAICVKNLSSLVCIINFGEPPWAPQGPLSKLEGPKTSTVPETSVLETPMISEAEQTPRLGVARNKVREKGKKIENNNIFFKQEKRKRKTRKLA